MARGKFITNQLELERTGTRVVYPLPLFAGVQIYVVVATCSCRKDHTVRMKGRCCDGLAAVCMQEIGVWLDTREFPTVKVKDFYRVIGSSAILESASGIYHPERLGQQGFEMKPTLRRLEDAHACLRYAKCR